jgi:hypothetical protein
MVAGFLTAALPAIGKVLKGSGGGSPLSALGNLLGGGNEQNVSQSASNSSVTNTSVGISNSFGGDANGSNVSDFASEIANSLSASNPSLTPNSSSTGYNQVADPVIIPQAIGIPNNTESFLNPTTLAVGSGVLLIGGVILAILKGKK